MSRCDPVCSAAISSLQSVGLIGSSSPTELGSSPAQSVTQHQHGRHDTMSVTLAFTFGCWRSSGGKSKSVDICDRSQADSFSDSHVAYPAVLFILHPFFFFLFDCHTICLLRSLSSKPALLCPSTAIFAGLLVSCSAS